MQPNPKSCLHPLRRYATLASQMGSKSTCTAAFTPDVQTESMYSLHLVTCWAKSWFAAATAVSPIFVLATDQTTSLPSSSWQKERLLASSFKGRVAPWFRSDQSAQLSLSKSGRHAGGRAHLLLCSKNAEGVCRGKRTPQGRQCPGAQKGIKWVKIQDTCNIILLVVLLVV